MRIGLNFAGVIIGVFTLLLILNSTASEVSAAPHFTGRRHEPSHVGKRLTERLRDRMPSFFTAPSFYPATAQVLFLRVDFQQDNDQTTTGDGVWVNCGARCDPFDEGPTLSNPDYWVKKNKAQLAAYYNEVSYGLLTLDITISPSVYRLPNQMPVYGSNNQEAQNIRKLIVDSVLAADAEVDFSQYDAIMFIHAGSGEEIDINGDSPNDVYSLYFTSSTIVAADGVNITEAIIMPQTDVQDNAHVDSLGVYAHEFGHWLGLPDLYQTSSPSNPAQRWDGPGIWSLMASGSYNIGMDGNSGSAPAHLDAWSKSYLGWVTPDTVADDLMNIELSPAESVQQAMRIPASLNDTDQYYLIENRQKSGFDAGLPGAGLLVWLIDDLVISQTIQSNSVNNVAARPGVAVVEADGDRALRNFTDGDDGSAGDPFPGSSFNTSFTPYTDPASIPYTGPASIYMTDITGSGININLNMGIAPAPPLNLLVSHTSATNLEWSAGSEDDLAAYKVYRNGAFIAETEENKYTDTSSKNGDDYTVTAVDTGGHESARSESVTVSITSAGGGGGCFIATAAFGSYEEPHVMILREFRDIYLLQDIRIDFQGINMAVPNIPGRSFVTLYYMISPPIADFIRQSEGLKGLVRIILIPVIGTAAGILYSSMIEKIIFLVAVVLVLYARRLYRLSQFAPLI